MICKIVCLFFHCITKTSYHHHHFSSLNLPPTTCVLHKLVSPQFPVSFYLLISLKTGLSFSFASLSVLIPGHVPSDQCFPPVSVCMLPCCRCHFLAQKPCDGEREKARQWEQASFGKKARGKRRKTRKQGNACRCRTHLVYKYANAVGFVICKWEITEC